MNNSVEVGALPDKQQAVVRDFGEQWQTWLEAGGRWGTNVAFRSIFGQGAPEKSAFGVLLSDAIEQSGYNVEPDVLLGANKRGPSLRSRHTLFRFEHDELTSAFAEFKGTGLDVCFCLVISPYVARRKLERGRSVDVRGSGLIGLWVKLPGERNRGAGGGEGLESALAAGDRMLAQFSWLKGGRDDIKTFPRQTEIFWEAFRFSPAELREDAESWMADFRAVLRRLKLSLTESVFSGPAGDEFRRVLATFVSGTARSETSPRVPLDEVAGVAQLLQHLQASAAVVLQGPPGTGKTYSALKLIDRLAGTWERSACRWTEVSLGQEQDQDSPAWADPPVLWELIQLHPSYAYEDLVRGLTTKPTPGGVEFAVEDKILVQLAKVAAKRGNRPTILILDEINRCNLSAVLGELILVLEKGYRDMPVRLQYVDPAKPEDAILTLPRNLWIIGTMNTADRSIAMVDFAIRRRFRFIDVEPTVEVVRDVNTRRFKPEVAEACVNAFKQFQELIAEPERRNLAIGHSYFLLDPSLRNGSGSPVPWKQQLRDRVEFEVLPLLREYEAEGFLSSVPSWCLGPRSAFQRLGLGESE